MSGGSRYDLEVKLLTSPETANDSCAAPQTITLPYVSASPLGFSSATDQDWFKFTTTAADVGKRVRVTTSVAGLSLDTDTAVAAYAGASCTALNQLGAYDDYYAYGDGSNQEDYLAPKPIYETGDVYVRIAPGYHYGLDYGALYHLAISLE